MPTTAARLSRELRLGEGLIGQCAADKRRMLITEMPADAVPIGSALFKVVPRNVIVLPVLFEDQVKAVIELASVTAFTDAADHVPRAAHRHYRHRAQLASKRRCRPKAC